MKLMTVLWNRGIKHLAHVESKGKTEGLQYVNPCLVEDMATETSTRGLGGNWFLVLPV